MTNPQHTHHSASPTGDPEAQSGVTSEPTVHEFLTRLATDPASRSAFDDDPQGALDRAGLGDMSAADVSDATSLVLDYSPVDAVAAYRTVQSSVDQFVTNTQHAALQLHSPYSTEQEELSMLQNSPEQDQDFSQESDVDVDIEQNDSHNVANVHDVLNGNEVLSGNTAVGGDVVAGVGNVVNSTVGAVGEVASGAVGAVTSTVDNAVDASTSLVGGAGATVHQDVSDLAQGVAVGDVTSTVGDLAGGDATKTISGVAGGDVAGGLLGNVTGVLGGDSAAKDRKSVG